MWNATNAGGPSIWSPRVPLQVPSVADATARSAITSPTEGLMVWQADTNKIYVHTGAAWVIVPTAAAPFSVPNVANEAARLALTGAEGDLVWQADTNVLYVYTGAAWAVVSTTDPSTLVARAAIVTVAAAAEVANVIALTISVDDGALADRGSATRLKIGLYTDVWMNTLANAMAFVIADGGDGSIESTDGGNAQVIALTGASSRVQLTVTDSLGASGQTLYVRVEPISDGTTGLVASVTRKTIAFD